MGLESSSEFFTISVNGVLYLQVCGAGSAMGGPPPGHSRGGDWAGRGAGGCSELWVQCPQPPGPGKGQGGTEHSR